MVNSQKKRVLVIGGLGYVGSKLFRHLSGLGLEIDTVDLELRGNKVNPGNFKFDFQYLTARFLSQYDPIILLAGHSNVAQSLRDPYGALENNLVKFANLISKLEGQRLVYASSSSVYTGVGGQAVDESWNSFNFVNMYDFSKYACDAVSQLLYNNFYALRFGTVCGASENLRLDLMINKMVYSALTEGKVTISNPEIRRPILGIEDLCLAIELIINGPDHPGIYNVCSFNTTVEEVGSEVARILDVPLVRVPPSPTYDFSMENGKISMTYGFQPRESVASIVGSLSALQKELGFGEFL